MKYKSYLLLLSVFLPLSFFSCSEDDNASEPEEITDPDPMVNPIPGQVSTYTAHVKTIIDAECARCHGNPPSQGAPMSLISFANVKEAVENRDLFGRLTSVNNVMPPSGKIKDGDILVIDDWIVDGLKE